MSIQCFTRAGGGLVALALLAFGGAAQAADLASGYAGYATPPSRPAVDGVNGTLDIMGGVSDDGEIYGGSGKIAAPIGGSYGVQGDGAIYNNDGAAYLGLGGHVFWRDPSKGLVGGYVGYSHDYGRGTVDVGRVGAEAEAYVGQLTARGIAGVEFADGETITKGGVQTSYEEGARFFDQADLAYYPTENVELFIGHRYTSGVHALGLGGEMMVTSGRSTAVSAFAEGRIAEGGNQAAWAGVKLHFGQSDKSLMRRAREDDPVSFEPDNLFGITNARKDVPVGHVF
ncbi:hypothetical protein [Roseibium aestuarii]|uniref:Uncharacterized protein n=1 Tax=Roseibium aestuarii TaxID=2600299 RepID=A0ABW4JVP5_9HYPH|nr:hypothetical protein [Roseibium aestuarii]